MPWKETCTMDERQAFIEAWLSGDFSVSELCRSFSISRKTGHKWLDRFKSEGMTGLADRSRARHSQAHKTPDALIEKILALKYVTLIGARSRYIQRCTERIRRASGLARAQSVKYSKYMAW
jgi:transposase